MGYNLFPTLCVHLSFRFGSLLDQSGDEELNTGIKSMGEIKALRKGEGRGKHFEGMPSEFHQMMKYWLKILHLIPVYYTAFSKLPLQFLPRWDYRASFRSTCLKTLGCGDKKAGDWLACIWSWLRKDANHQQIFGDCVVHKADKTNCMQMSTLTTFLSRYFWACNTVQRCW